MEDFDYQIKHEQINWNWTTSFKEYGSKSENTYWSEKIVITEQSTTFASIDYYHIFNTELNAVISKLKSGARGSEKIKKGIDGTILVLSAADIAGIIAIPKPIAAAFLILGWITSNCGDNELKNYEKFRDYLGDFTNFIKSELGIEDATWWDLRQYDKMKGKVENIKFSSTQEKSTYYSQQSGTYCTTTINKITLEADVNGKHISITKQMEKNYSENY